MRSSSLITRYILNESISGTRYRPLNVRQKQFNKVDNVKIYTTEKSIKIQSSEKKEKKEFPLIYPYKRDK